MDANVLFVGRRALQQFPRPVLLVIVAVLGNLLLIANPGYFSHDEFDRERDLRLLGLRTYLTHSFRQNPEASFAAPWRPIGFAIQAVHAGIFDYPQIVHGISLAIHAASALSLYYVLQRCANSDVALLASALFLIHPSTSHAVGWAAATHDLIWVFFALWSLYFGVQFVRRPEVLCFRHVVLSALTYTASLMSKETAIVVPIAFVLFGLNVLRLRICGSILRFLALSVVYLGISAAYFVFRWPNILNSLSDSGSAYSLGLETVLQNAVVYFAYPFTITVTEANNAIFASNLELAVAIATHGSVVIILGILYGAAKSFLYLALYFASLLPLLFVGFQASHYLYASAMLSSVSIAAILLSPSRKGVACKMLATTALSVLVIHSVLNQVSIRNDGICMHSLDSAVHRLEDLEGVLIRQSASGIFSWVANRYVVNRRGFSVVSHESVVEETTLDVAVLCTT